MASKIARSQVVLAMDCAPCTVPDFLKREKARLVWSKVFVSKQGNRIDFVELNLLQRILRYMTRGYWYGDTIINNKDFLCQVKITVSNIKTFPAYQDAVLRLIPQAKHLEDCNCLIAMLKYCLNKTNHAEQREDLDRHIAFIESKYESGELRMKPMEFSDEFLTGAVALVREKHKKDPKDTLWETISKGFMSRPVTQKILKEIVGVPLDQEHLRDIAVPSEAQAAFEQNLGSIQTDLNKLRPMGTLEENLETYGELEKFSQRLRHVKQVLEPFLEKPEGKGMIQTLYGQLMQVHYVLVRAYLDGNEMMARRLFDRAAFTHQSWEHWERIGEFVKGFKSRCEAAIVQTVDSFKENPFDQHGDTFSVSCNQCVKRTDGRSWREVIAEELKQPHYQKLIKERIESDPTLLGWTEADYCQKIMQPHAPSGYPEWVAFSNLVQAPVVVVTTDGRWKLSGVINPAIKKPAYMLRFWGEFCQSMSRNKRVLDL
jgi:hypothetical protein